jgi:hypothetical protein
MFNRTLHQFSKSRKQDRVLPRSLEPDRAVDKGRAPARSGVVRLDAIFVSALRIRARSRRSFAFLSSLDVRARIARERRSSEEKKKSSHGGHGGHGVILVKQGLKTGIKRLING